MYIVYALLYTLVIGGFSIYKKLAVKKSNEIVVLVLFVTIGFLLSFIWIPFDVSISPDFIWIFVVKGFICVLNWYLVLKVLKNANISVVVLSTVISTVLTFLVGILFMGENATLLQYFGSTIVIASAICINFVNNKEKKAKLSWKHMIYLLISALISTSCSVIDKYTTTYLTSYQVQFWFLLFAFVFAWLFFGVECIRSKKFLIQKSDFKNWWIYCAGLALFFGDMFLFLAYREATSQMIMISVISKMKSIVAVLLGVIIFKEEKKWWKILIALFAVVGVVMLSL